MLTNRKTLMAAAFLTLAPTLAFAATPTASGAQPTKPVAAQTQVVKTQGAKAHVVKTSAVKKRKPMASKMKHQAKFAKKTAAKKTPDIKKS